MCRPPRHDTLRAGRLVAAAVARIDEGPADVGVLACEPHLVDFYTRAGWGPVAGATIVAGADGEAWLSDDVLMARDVGSRSVSFRAALRTSPLRVGDER